VLEVLYYHAKFGGARIYPATVTATNVEFFLSVCLFVCLSVRRASVVMLASVKLARRRQRCSCIYFF